MDRERAKAVRETIVDLIEDAMDSMGLKYVSAGAGYSPDSIKVTISFVEKAEFSSAKSKVPSQQEVDSGLARPGSVVWAIEDGLYYKAVILAVRRTKYLFEYRNYPEQGKYVCSFRNLKVSVSDDLKADGEE